MYKDKSDHPKKKFLKANKESDYFIENVQHIDYQINYKQIERKRFYIFIDRYFDSRVNLQNAAQSKFVSTIQHHL